MADNNIVKEKIRTFVKNHTKKRSLENRSGCGTEASVASQNLDDLLEELSKETGGKCRACEHVGELMGHLDTSGRCRLSYVKHYLTGDEENVRKSSMRLGVLLWCISSAFRM